MGRRRPQANYPNSVSGSRCWIRKGKLVRVRITAGVRVRPSKVLRNCSGPAIVVERLSVSSVHSALSGSKRSCWLLIAIPPQQKESCNIETSLVRTQGAAVPQAGIRFRAWRQSGTPSCTSWASFASPISHCLLHGPLARSGLWHARTRCLGRRPQGAARGNVVVSRAISGVAPQNRGIFPIWVNAAPARWGVDQFRNSQSFASTEAKTATKGAANIQIERGIHQPGRQSRI